MLTCTNFNIIMFKTNPIIIFALFAGIFLFFSCSNEQDTTSLIQGKWNIIKASRNGRKTSTFENGYFQFSGSDSIETNILGEKVSTIYHLENKTIISGSILPKIIVNKVNKDSLFLRTKISSFIFDFILKKNKDYEK